MMSRELEQKMKEVLQKAVENRELGGANVLVTRDGRELCYLEAGFADIAAGKKIGKDTIFRLYSMTKPVTAVAAMILLERGEICLQTPVEEYLPSFAGGKVCCGTNVSAFPTDGLCRASAGPASGEGEVQLEDVERPMNLYDLLHMTSGLTYGDSESLTEMGTRGLFNEAERSLYKKEPMTTQEFAGKAGKIPLLFQPGTSWKYGISADIMGAVIEKVTGESFGGFLIKEIFEPLGMTDTAFNVSEEKRDRLAKAYETGEDGRLEEYTGNFLGIRNAMDDKARFESGGAGLVSTISDYEKFAGMLLNNGSLGGKRILQPATVEYLTRGRLSGSRQESFEKWSGQSGFSYGNFMRVLWNPWQSAVLGRQMEYCWDGWLGCYFVNCPQEKVTFLVMQQKKDAGKLVARLKNILFSHDL
ncbi:serine hydrolase domain-containing protein [Lacrimispora sp.]|uniref:serine hydrolase domain-containing protein n=1 Tax=Lacrimispora sp. TaxID=2719234 RepID=UPI0028A75E97|nr:serine hydrolase domain-containing protein [Lacrimispora sp.]